jgi:hypothetical protein
VTKVGIDAPFGWPIEFVDALARHSTNGRWTSAPVSRLALRETDRLVHLHTGKRPLSVSTDRIAYTAMRCARLLDEYANRTGEPIDRSGITTKPVEVYPAAALRAWGFDTKDYKGRKEHQLLARQLLVPKFVRYVRRLVQIEPSTEAACAGSDHLLDAVVSAVVARLAELGQTRRPAEELEADRSGREGWIHLPAPGSHELSTDAALQ